MAKREPSPLQLQVFFTVTGILAAASIIGGCRSNSPASSEWVANIPGESRWVRTELYFGLSEKGGSGINEQQFDAFVAEEITPRFPDGLTVVDATGKWRNASGQIIREKTKLLILLHEPGARSNQSIEEIRDAYKSRFGQESVLRVDSTAGVSF